MQGDLKGVAEQKGQKRLSAFLVAADPDTDDEMDMAAGALLGLATPQPAAVARRKIDLYTPEKMETAVRELITLADLNNNVNEVRVRVRVR
jgi:hypothetical protein